MVAKYYKNVALLLAFMVFVMTAGTADAAFYFRGYTYNETNVTLSNTNVSIEAYNFGQNGPQLAGTDYASSNAIGFFNVSVTNDQPNYIYKIVIKHFINNETTGTLDYIGPSLPEFPGDMIRFLTMAPASPMNFYLRKGATINFNARNTTGGNPVSNQNFTYMIKDTRLGYPIAENFNVEQGNVTVHVPRERNYSIMIFPNQSLPIFYNLNNISDYASTNYIVNITFDTGIAFKWVSGYATYNGAAGFENLNVIAYLMEPGDMLAKKHPMPENMAAWQPGGGWPNTFNNTTGFYNFTLPGSAQGSGVNLMLFATAKYNSTTYYGAFRNITLSTLSSNQSNFNFSLATLLGNVGNITLESSTGEQINVATKLLPFQIINGTDGTNITNKFAHVEMEVNYSSACTNCSTFKWMLDTDQNENGSFSIPALNANIRKIDVFMQDFAPIKTSKNTTQLATWPVNITMTSFDNKKPDGTQLSNVFIDMLLSKPECDTPYPASGCSLMPDPTTGQNETEFNPFKVVMGGGKISLRIKQTAQRITVHYKNVDMLASGPPDALFDDSASQSQSGSSLEQAWRFGSKGPEIYDEVLIGVPISSSMSISGVKIGKLYDENWNSVWNTTDTNAANNVPSDYSQFPSTWFGTGYTCSTTDNSSSCYINTTEGTLWLRIPHFSGVGPTISGTTTTTSSGGSSGSTGGGGVVSSESYANIAKAERYDKSLIANTPVTYTFKAPELGVYEIAVTGKANENDIAVRVEALKGMANGVTMSAPGAVYKNLNIIVGTKNIKEAIVRFRVENSWLNDNNLAGSDVKLAKWDGSKWNTLETSEKNRDDKFIYFEAKTDSFSSFAIIGVKGATPAATAVSGATETPAKPVSPATTPVSTKKTPGFESVIVLAALLAIYLLGRNRR